MDSLTQLALGSAVGYAVLGKSIGPRAALYGGILGTLPDLDVFIPFGGPVEDFTYHRSFSHSLFVHAILSPLLAWLLQKAHSSQALSLWRLTAMVFLCLSTHALLDSFTVYGTQLFWPLSEYPVSLSNLFIIDPLYTLPILFAVFSYLVPSLSDTKRLNITKFGLSLSSVYLLWSFGAKSHIDHLNFEALKSEGIDSSTYVSTPTLFSTLLWRSVVVVDDRYYEIYTSIFDDASEVSIVEYTSHVHLLDKLQDDWDINRLKWFTHGLFSVKQVKNDILISDLRMGIEGSYVFTFKIAELNEAGQIRKRKIELLNSRPSLDRLNKLLRRISDPSINLKPQNETQR